MPGRAFARRWARRLSLRPGSRLRAMLNANTGTWLGVVLVAGGFAAIFVSWGQVAGVLSVAQQMPALTAGGVLGLALIIVGATVADVGMRKQDGIERQQQVFQLSRVLAEARALTDARIADSGDAQWRRTGEA